MLAETEQPQLAARSEHLADRVDILPAIVIGQHVKQAAVDNIVELPRQLAERQRIHDYETGIQLAGSGFGLGPRDGFLDEINPVHDMASCGKEQCTIAGTAAGIENRTFDPVGHGDQGWLEMTDLPRGLACIRVPKMVGLGGCVRHGDDPLWYVVSLQRPVFTV
jgi:hypothetical protein